MKKTILTFILLLFINETSLFAQTYGDVLYLKNGSIIHGIILELIPEKTVKIKSGENLFVFNASEIEKITKEEIKTPITSTPAPLSNQQDAPNKPDLAKVQGIMAGIVNSESGGLVKMYSIEKVNGRLNNISGTEGYEFDYKMVIQPTTTVYKYKNHLSTDWGNFKAYTKEPTGMGMGSGMASVWYPNNAIVIWGIALFEKTDNGWAFENYKNTNDVLLNVDMVKDAQQQTRIESKTSDAVEKELFFRIRHLPGSIETFNIKISKITYQNMPGGDVNINAAKGTIIEYFKSANRYEPCAESDYNASSDSSKTIYQINIKDIKWVSESGVKITNEKYNGYRATITFDIIMLDYNLKKINSLSYTSVGGSPLLNDSKNSSFLKALEKSKIILDDFVYRTAPVISNFITISDSSRKGDIQKIEVSNGQLLSKKIGMGYIILLKKDIIMKSGKVSYQNIIAKGKVLDVTTNGSAIVKILEGEKKLKEAIKNNRSEVVLWSIFEEHLNLYTVSN